MDEMKIAKSLIKRYKSNNPFDICGCMGIIVLTVPLVGVRGFYQHYKRNSMVYISEELNDHLRLFVCAHELGHAVMHRTSNEIFMDTRTFLKISTYERQADRFAINLLLPEDDFIEDYRECTLEQIARGYGMNQELMKYRIQQIKK